MCNVYDSPIQLLSGSKVSHLAYVKVMKFLFHQLVLWYCQVEFGVNGILFSKFLSPPSQTVQWFIFYLVFFIVSWEPIIFQVKGIKEIICRAHLKLSLRHSSISFRVVLSLQLFSQTLNNFLQHKGYYNEERFLFRLHAPIESPCEFFNSKF